MTRVLPENCKPVRSEPIDVSILVVSFNTRELTLASLRSALAETTAIDSEIIVVDNASSDGSAAAIASDFPGVRLIASGENIGFAAANNLAARHARGRYLLLLNPDTIVLDRAIEKLVAFAARRPEARIWGGRTLFPDGRLNPASCWQRMTPWNLLCRATGLTAMFRNTELFNGEAYGGFARDRERAVDIVSGCFLLIERELWEALGGFDPAFFMYGEEADLCLRAATKGARPAITPEATIIHYGGASETARTGKMVRLLTAKTDLINRHFPWWAQGLGKVLLGAWPLSRLVALRFAAMLTGSARFGDAALTWGEIWNRREDWRYGYAGRALPASAPPPMPTSAASR